MTEALIALGGLIVSIVLAFIFGRNSEKNRRAKDTLKRTDRGRDAVIEGRASGDTPDERVRKNDGRW